MEKISGSTSSNPTSTGKILSRILQILTCVNTLVELNSPVLYVQIPQNTSNGGPEVEITSFGTMRGNAALLSTLSSNKGIGDILLSGIILLLVLLILDFVLVNLWTELATIILSLVLLLLSLHNIYLVSQLLIQGASLPNLQISAYDRSLSIAGGYLFIALLSISNMFSIKKWNKERGVTTLFDKIFSSTKIEDTPSSDLK